jgi:lipoprotein-anchoring transpeptidase ErfK/SrfK
MDDRLARPGRPGRHLGRQVIVAAVAVAVAAGALAGCGRADGGEPGVTDSRAPAVTMTVSPLATSPMTSPMPTTSPTAAATASSGPATQAPPGQPPTRPGSEPATPPVLRPGDSGTAVRALQQQLAAAGYWVGVPDGTYGLVTQQAVLALQKAAGLPRDGLAGTATRRALAAGTRPTAHSRAGRVLEVDLARQLVLVVKDGAVEQVLNTSTGTNAWYTVHGVRHLADTPKGTWTIFRQVDGVDHGTLGDLYRPKYFHTDGIAIHGYPQVPAYPASHGCVRLTNAAMDWMWSSGVAEIGTTVLVY